MAYRVAAYGEQDGELTKGEFFPVLPGDDKFRDANPYYLSLIHISGTGSWRKRPAAM